MARTWNSGQYPYLTERTGIAYEGERNNCLEACRHRKHGWVGQWLGAFRMGFFWSELGGWELQNMNQR
jgi:hypothetical protein